MNAMTQAYRTTCIPTTDRLDAIIPSEYIGQKLEIIILPAFEEATQEDDCLTDANIADEITQEMLNSKTNIRSLATQKEMERKYAI
ncbi:MAG: hypothetical protein FWH22_10125 [Fibromonadales bacterium]|nr:hypothetical protein [Fibromonadales bacterium]